VTWAGQRSVSSWKRSSENSRFWYESSAAGSVVVRFSSSLATQPLCAASSYRVPRVSPGVPTVGEGEGEAHEVPRGFGARPDVAPRLATGEHEQRALVRGGDVNARAYVRDERVLRAPAALVRLEHPVALGRAQRHCAGEVDGVSRHHHQMRQARERRGQVVGLVRRRRRRGPPGDAGVEEAVRFHQDDEAQHEQRREPTTPPRRQRRPPPRRPVVAVLRQQRPRRLRRDPDRDYHRSAKAGRGRGNERGRVAE